jgi:hypothetical protein
MWQWSLLYTLRIVSDCHLLTSFDKYLLCTSCGTYGVACALQKSNSAAEPASLEGEFEGQATYYNESQVSSDFSTCGIERTLSLNEDNENIYVAALNMIQFDPYTVDGIPSSNPVCQKKALVKGPAGEIIVRFVDRCPECKQGIYNNRCYLFRIY